MQSLVPSLSPNNLIPLTTFFFVVFLSLAKIIALQIDKDGTPPVWQKWDPSGLAKMGPLRIGKNRDPSGLAKMGPLRIGKNETLPDWQKWDPPYWQN